MPFLTPEGTTLRQNGRLIISVLELPPRGIQWADWDAGIMNPPTVATTEIEVQREAFDYAGEGLLLSFTIRGERSPMVLVKYENLTLEGLIRAADFWLIQVAEATEIESQME